MQPGFSGRNQPQPSCFVNELSLIQPSRPACVFTLTHQVDCSFPPALYQQYSSGFSLQASVGPETLSYDESRNSGASKSWPFDHARNWPSPRGASTKKVSPLANRLPVSSVFASSTVAFTGRL